MATMRAMAASDNDTKGRGWLGRNWYWLAFGVWVGVAVALFFLYLCYLSPKNEAKTSNDIVRCCKEGWTDVNTVRTALALAGAVLLVANMLFVVLRILRTDLQLRKTDEQIAAQRRQIDQQQHTNFLHTLHHGIGMLYSDSLTRQLGGVSHLHKTAQTHEAKREEILDVFCTFVRVASLVRGRADRDNNREW